MRHKSLRKLALPLQADNLQEMINKQDVTVQDKNKLIQITVANLFSFILMCSLIFLTTI